MQNNPKILTGFSFIDQKWGGVYSGGNYLIFGPQKSGKTILALNIIEYLIQSKFSILLITSERKKNLEIQASSIYFDIIEPIDSGMLKVVRIEPSLNDLSNLKNIVNENIPTVIIVDEIADKNLRALKSNYDEFLEFLEEKDVTSFFIASVPKDNESKSFVKEVAKNSTALIQLHKTSERRNYSGIVSLKPNIGHFEGEFETTYKIEPVKGFITFADNENSLYKILTKSDNSPIVNKKQEFEYSNVYSLEEFKFLLESKISLSKRTGSRINIINYEVIHDSVSSAELCNVLKKRLSKGDKICFSEKMIYILPEQNESTKIQKLAYSLDEEAMKFIKEPDRLDFYIKKTIQLLKPNFILK